MLNILMKSIEDKIAELEAEIKFYSELNEREPDRKLSVVVKNLKVRLGTLEELVPTR